jgi:L-aminoadipate-semialdehyde dehydrogenase
MTVEDDSAMTHLSKQDQETLFSFPELSLPTDFPPSNQLIESSLESSISDKTSLGVLQLLASQGDHNGNTNNKGAVNPFSILLSSFAILLSKYTGQEDIPLVTSKKDDPLLILFNITPKSTFIDILAQCSHLPSDETSAATTTTEDATNEKNVKDLSQIVQSVSHSKTPVDPLIVAKLHSLFKIRFFNLTDTSAQTLSSSSAMSSSHSDFSVYISQSPTLRRLLPIDIRILYNSVLFSHKRMTDMLDQWMLLIQTVSQNPQLPLGEASLLTEFSRTVIPNPRASLGWDHFEGAITDIFAKNATSFPNKTCIVESLDRLGASRTYTYAQINEASNALAHHLIRKGIQREDVVVLYSFRGVDLVIAIMGVLKAGATFSVIGN